MNKFGIEIMDHQDGCPMKCATCPTPIQKMEGSSKSAIPGAYEILRKKLAKTPFSVSFTDDFTKIPSRFEMLEDSQPVMITSYVQFPFDQQEFQKSLGEIARRFPFTVVNIGTLSRKLDIPKDVSDGIEMMGRSFFESDLDTLQISINNNSLTWNNFSHQVTRLPNVDRSFYKKLIDGPVGKFGEYTKVFYHKEEHDVESYHSILRIRRTRQSFQVTRRTVCPLGELSPTKEGYRQRAWHDVASPEEFIPRNMTISLTPMGVRINHASFDIQNPFFWITYEELEAYLERASDIVRFCQDLRAVVVATLGFGLEDRFFESTTEQTIKEISEMRRKVIKW